MAQFTTVDMKNHLLRTGAATPALKSLNRARDFDEYAMTVNYLNLEKTMYQTDEGPCCSPPESMEQTAERLRKQLKGAEKQAACERKAQKKAARLERQRKADRDLAIDTFADVASDPDANALARVEAAKNLIQITGSY